MGVWPVLSIRGKEGWIMEINNESAELGLGEVPPGGDTYSGQAAYLYTSKMNGSVSVASVCEILASSDAFNFALNSHGRIFFKSDGRLKSQQLDIETTLTEQGMKVGGVEDFLKSNMGDSCIYSFNNALNLLLSDKRLFNPSFGFPAESARIFMRPIAMRSEGDDEYEFIVPYFRVYEGGVISVVFSSVLGFGELNVGELVSREVNRSNRNIISVLCEREIYQACVECQISQMSLRERVAQRQPYEAVIKSVLENSEEIEFLDEKLTVYELIGSDQFTITDMARNLLSLVARAVTGGAVKARINWFGAQYRDESIGEYWQGKPLIYISSHTRQKSSSIDNRVVHRQLVNSVMARAYIVNNVEHAVLVSNDLRSMDDFNNFYSESASLLLASADVEFQLEELESFTFDNLTSDVQVLNEAAHLMQVFYSYMSLDLNACTSAIDVARLEIKVLRFEESLLSAHKYGEVANYIQEVRQGGHLVTLDKLLRKKMVIVRKALELDADISSESYSRRIIIVFGLVASAVLSPELIQPVMDYYKVAPQDGSLKKVFGIFVSFATVAGFLILVHYVFKVKGWLVKVLKER